MIINTDDDDDDVSSAWPNPCLAGFGAGQERLDHRINGLAQPRLRGRGSDRKLGGGAGAVVRSVLGRRGLPPGRHNGMVCSPPSRLPSYHSIPPHSVAFCCVLGQYRCATGRQGGAMRRGGSDRFVVAIGRGALVPAADEMALAPAMQAAMLNGGPPRGLVSG